MEWIDKLKIHGVKLAPKQSVQTLFLNCLNCSLVILEYLYRTWLYVCTTWYHMTLQRRLMTDKLIYLSMRTWLFDCRMNPHCVRFITHWERTIVKELVNFPSKHYHVLCDPGYGRVINLTSRFKLICSWCVQANIVCFLW